MSLRGRLRDRGNLVDATILDYGELTIFYKRAIPMSSECLTLTIGRHFVIHLRYFYKGEMGMSHCTLTAIGTGTRNSAIFNYLGVVGTAGASFRQLVRRLIQYDRQDIRGATAALKHHGLAKNYNGIWFQTEHLPADYKETKRPEHEITPKLGIVLSRLRERGKDGDTAENLAFYSEGTGVPMSPYQVQSVLSALRQKDLAKHVGDIWYAKEHSPPSFFESTYDSDVTVVVYKGSRGKRQTLKSFRGRSVRIQVT